MSRVMRARLRQGSRMRRRRPRASDIAVAAPQAVSSTLKIAAAYWRHVFASARSSLSAAHGETVELRLPVVLAHAPLGFDGATTLEPM